MFVLNVVNGAFDEEAANRLKEAIVSTKNRQNRNLKIALGLMIFAYAKAIRYSTEIRKRADKLKTELENLKKKKAKKGE